MDEELYSFFSDLVEETHLALDEYPVPEMAFTSIILERIEGLLGCKEITQEHCIIRKSNGDTIGEIHAYSESTNGEVLYLFFTDYNHSASNIPTKNNTECQVAFNRLQGFYNMAYRAGFSDLDEDTPEYKAGRFIYDNMHNYNSVNLIVLSNCIINSPQIRKLRINTKPVFVDVWDIRKIYGNTHSMSDHLAINIDFSSDEYKRFKIPYIQMESTQYGYKCVQAMFPAKLLYSLYERYNTNLLYNNVRYFLGLKGAKDKKPNVAMLDTLRNENEMFLAYNNGITALAKSIESDTVGEKTDVTDQDSSTSHQYISMGILKSICDFRIINGGQTTAVIFNSRNTRANTNGTNVVNLTGVYVQVKLIISDEIEKISGNIALSSNFQNKVSYSDFSVGNSFNVELEKLSRNIVTPSSNNDTVYWFYERLKGQYDEQKKTIRTKADKDYFDFRFPKDKKFSKEDVAKVWTNWNQAPYDSVKGAASTYGIYMKNIVTRGFCPDESYYKETIALLIIYRFLLSRKENKLYTNGKASVIAYTMAMLSYQTLGRFNLYKVWENQSLSDNTKIYLNNLSDRIFELISAEAQRQNTSILSYGKNKSAYEYLCKQEFGINSHLLDNDLVRL